MKIVFVPLQRVAVDMFDSHGIEIESIFLVPDCDSQAESHEQDNAFDILYCSNVSISKSVFSNIDNPFLHQTLIGNPTVFLLFFSRNIYFSDCTFEGNNVTGLLLLRSHFTVFDTLNFTGNSAYRGGAMVFLIGSTLKLSQNGTIYFVDNSAVSKGGAIYVDSSNSYAYNSQSVLPDCIFSGGTS